MDAQQEFDDDAMLLADRVNIEPPIFRGCSDSELVQLAAVLTVVNLPLSLVIAIGIGKPLYFLGMVMLGDLFGIWFGAGWFQRQKRGRPDYFYIHRARLWLSRRGIWRLRLIHRTGAWDVHSTRERL
jgi:conjugative transfer region protein (TIGR03750 family)